MVVLLGLELGEPWLTRVRDQVGDEAMVLAVSLADAEEVARRLPVSVLVANLEPLTAEKLLTCSRLRAGVPGPVTVFLGPQDVRDQLEVDHQPAPDLWIAPDATPTETAVTLRAALQQARYIALAAGGGSDPGEVLPLNDGEDRVAHEQETLLHLMSALAGNTDLDRLLRGYVEAATELTRSANYCFLWQEPGSRTLRVRLSRGILPELEVQGRLAPSDALPEWCRESNRVLTRAELAQWSDAVRARAIAVEMSVFRAQVAVPLTVQGRLLGLLLLGEKVVGEPYRRAELETLFLLSGMVALQVQNLELQGQVHHTKAYLEQSLHGMQCGLLTMGTDGRLVFCNPYAARALGTEVENLRGADLRCLPAPLGDYLHAAYVAPDASVAGLEVTLSRTGAKLRVSTAALVDDQGRRTGSVMLLEDITAPEADRDQNARKETLQVLSSIVGRLAHHVRTPLTAIRTYAQLMGRSGSDEGLNQFYEQTVRPELERLERLIDEQLKLLQQPEPQFQLVSMDALVREAVAEVCAAMPEGPAPEVEAASGLPEVVADPAVTREALVYLLRYLRRNCDGVVRVGLETRNGPGGQRVAALLSCVPAGDPGPSPQVLDPLYALQEPEGDLGPAISRQLIEKQGGGVDPVTGDRSMGFLVSFPVLVTRRLERSGVQTNG